jgi:hypothetical protein
MVPFSMAVSILAVLEVREHHLLLARAIILNP